MILFYPIPSVPVKQKRAAGTPAPPPAGGPVQAPSAFFSGQGVSLKSGCLDFSQGGSDCKEKSARNTVCIPSIFDAAKRPSPVEKDGGGHFRDTP